MRLGLDLCVPVVQPNPLLLTHPLMLHHARSANRGSTFANEILCPLVSAACKLVLNPLLRVLWGRFSAEGASHTPSSPTAFRAEALPLRHMPEEILMMEEIEQFRSTCHGTSRDG